MGFYSWILCFSPLKELTICKNLDIQPRKQEPCILNMDVSICSGEGVEWGEGVGNYSLWCINKSVCNKKDGSWPSSTHILSKKNPPHFPPKQSSPAWQVAAGLNTSVRRAQWRVTSGCLCLEDHLLCGSTQLGLRSVLPPPSLKETLENLLDPSKGQGAMRGAALLTL